jgi:4-amino-4-deoxy-L-arabinose transferase-like glycosyltransferase
MYWLAVVGVTAAAAVLRLWNLASIPPGLSFDEAANALDSLRILEAGFRPIFVGHTVYGTAREGIHLYPQAAFLWLLGHDCGYSIRLASALVGTATVPLVYLLVNEMFPSRASIGRTKWLALIAAILVGFSYWHVIRVR